MVLTPTPVCVWQTLALKLNRTLCAGRTENLPVFVTLLSSMAGDGHIVHYAGRTGTLPAAQRSLWAHRAAGSQCTTACREGSPRMGSGTPGGLLLSCCHHAFHLSTDPDASSHTQEPAHQPGLSKTAVGACFCGLPCGETSLLTVWSKQLDSAKFGGRQSSLHMKIQTPMPMLLHTGTPHIFCMPQSTEAAWQGSQAVTSSHSSSCSQEDSRRLSAAVGRWT